MQRTHHNDGHSLHTETACRRVTAADVQGVTAEDIERTARTMTPEQFRAALRVMADHNKTGMVLASTGQPTVEAALQHVNVEMVRDARAKTQASSAMQALLLAQTTEGMRKASVATIERMQQAGDLF